MHGGHTHGPHHVDVPTCGTLEAAPVGLSVVCQAVRVLEQITTLVAQKPTLSSAAAVGM